VGDEDVGRAVDLAPLAAAPECDDVLQHGLVAEQGRVPLPGPLGHCHRNGEA
jgi:hypothetical protein